MDSVSRAAALAAYAAETAGCERCSLAATRGQVVFGAGDPDAELMLVGEAPGYHEDQGGEPFAGQTGDLLVRLLQGIGLERDEVYLANVLKCRPPQNRDPLEAEIAACEPHLFRQIELIRPRVVATLGNFATKLLSGRPFGITKVHGQRARGHARLRPRSSSTRSTTPPRRCTRRRCCGRWRRTSRASRRCSGGRLRAVRDPRAAVPGRSRCPSRSPSSARSRPAARFSSASSEP